MSFFLCLLLNKGVASFLVNSVIFRMIFDKEEITSRVYGYLMANPKEAERISDVSGLIDSLFIGQTSVRGGRVSKLTIMSWAKKINIDLDKVQMGVETDEKELAKTDEKELAKLAVLRVFNEVFTAPKHVLKKSYHDRIKHLQQQ